MRNGWILGALLLLGGALTPAASALEQYATDEELMEEGGAVLDEATRREMARRRHAYGGDTNYMSIRKASKRHDRVTIIVNKSFSATIDTDTSIERQSGMEWSMDKWFTIRRDEEGNWLAQPRFKDTGIYKTDNPNKPEVKFESTSEHTGEGTVEEATTATATISGAVLQVLPNKHLVVQARTEIVLPNREKRMTTLTGVIDPKDLDVNNTVNADYVMDLTVKFTGEGDIVDAQRRGWLARFLDKVNPF